MRLSHRISLDASGKSQEKLIFALSPSVGFLCPVPYVEKGTFIFTFFSLFWWKHVQETSHPPVPLSPDLCSGCFSVLLVSCIEDKGWCKTKANSCNLLCLLWQSRPSRLFLLPFCFLTLPLFSPFFFFTFLFSFCLHAALICISPWCDVLMERMATRCVCQKI